MCGRKVTLSFPVCISIQIAFQVERYQALLEVPIELPVVQGPEEQKYKKKVERRNQSTTKQKQNNYVVSSP